MCPAKLARRSGRSCPGYDIEGAVVLTDNRFDSILPVGEFVRLREVKSSDFEVWASWFNRESVTRNLPQGLFPNSAMDQERWYEKAALDQRFIAMVERLDSAELLGVCSISEIDWHSKSGQVSTVVPVKVGPQSMPGLEARALLTQHAVEKMGLRRLWAGQAYPSNIKWSSSQALIGWMVEGFAVGGFWKGDQGHDVLRTAAISMHIKELIEERGGSLWPGLSTIKDSLHSK